METALPWIQIILAVVLVLTILAQRSNASLGGAFGSGNDGGSGYHTRRGFEKFLFHLTIVLGILFAASVFVALFL